jgi:hypothetical protein
MTTALYRDAQGHAWVGEQAAGWLPDSAAQTAEVPAADDPRWVPGVPRELDTQVLTLSPFYPTGRLGACVERKSSTPLGQYPNHPPFEGCLAWMPLSAIAWNDVPGQEPASVPVPRSSRRPG